MVSERSVEEAEDPPSPDRQVPLIEKHPPVKLIPLAKVEEAVVEVTFSRFVEIPPAKVDVAVVVEMKELATTVPPTESFEYGDVVPIPTLPVLLIYTKSEIPLKDPPLLN